MVELADVVRQGADAYRRACAQQMLPSHHRAFRDIERCRTAELGGSLYVCEDCEHLDFAYHSCRNRHCPKCHHVSTKQWLERLEERLLPCDYALVTFTLPSELRLVARSNQRLVYSILMRESAAALLLLARDRDWVGGRLGILAVLHTWSRDLGYHLHVHLLATAGGLTADSEAWIRPANPRFLLPGYALSVIFRAKVRDAFRDAQLANDLDPNIWKKKWSVHVGRTGNGQHAIGYLSRYVNRVAITNSRIESLEDDHVTFRYRHSRTRQTRRMTFSVDRFLARFLQHVLPRGFHKIRYYGLFSPAAAADRDTARNLLELHDTRARSPSRKEPTPDSSGTLAHIDLQPLPEYAPSVRFCPVCRRGHMRLLAVLGKERKRPPP